MDNGSSVHQKKPLLHLRGIEFHNAGKTLIRKLDLTVLSGRTLMIMGANGAGKSLLLRLIHGLLQPSQGQVLWRNRPLDRHARDQQAMVFQHPVLLRQSVLDNLRFVLRARNIDKKKHSSFCMEALQQARLEHMALHPARLLSGGEQQRLALVRSLICQPELLLLDEPTANLDPASTHAVETLIHEAQSKGVTIIMVTHDLGQARRLGQDIAFLHAGRLVEYGSAEQLLSMPRSAAMLAWKEGRLYLDDCDPI